MIVKHRPAGGGKKYKKNSTKSKVTGVGAIMLVSRTTPGGFGARPNCSTQGIATKTKTLHKRLGIGKEGGRMMREGVGCERRAEARRSIQSACCYPMR
jgi:hypothetical protein